MSYEPTNWKTGDVVTSAKLNKLENAVANGGVKMFTVSDIPGTMQAGLTAQDFVGAWIFNDSYYEAVVKVGSFDGLPFIPVFTNGREGPLYYYPEDGYISDQQPVGPE